MKHAKCKPSPRRRLLNWINATPARKWSAISICLLAVALGGILTWRAIVPPIPPALDAPHQDLVAFLAENNDRISSTQRDRLVSELATRYFNANADDRLAFKKQWLNAGLDRATARTIRTQMEFALAYNLADQYQQLPQAQKGPFLDRILFMINTMDQDGEFLKWVNQNPAADVFKDPAKAMTEASPLQRKLLYNTTAEQRAALPVLGRDLIQRAKRYQ